MIDSEIRASIDQIVQGHITAGNEFTAWDVTRELRAQGFTVRHDEAKEVVHGLYHNGQMPGYTRELRDMGGPIPAWCYYPLVNSGGSTDDDDDQVTVPVGSVPSHLAPSSLRSYGTPNVATLPVQGPPQVGGPVPPLVKGRNARGALLIPARITRALGLQPGDIAYVERNGSDLEVVPHGSISTSFKHYLVDRRCNIRIPRRTQEKAGITSSRMKIELQDSAHCNARKVVVRSA